MAKKSQELTAFMKTASLPALSNEDMADAIAAAVDEGTSGGSDAVYLTFSGKTDLYALGRNKDSIDPEEVYLLEPQSLIAGWVCWKKTNVVDRHEWSIYKAAEQAVSKHELEDHSPYNENAGDGWKRVLGFGVITTDKLHTPIKFSMNNKSGRNSVGDMFEEIRKRALAEEPCIPAIRFGSESFMAQDQKNFKPVFHVEAWVTRDAADAYMEERLDIDGLLTGKAPRKKKKAKK